jgi:large subunit ribosomal protein L25
MKTVTIPGAQRTDVGKKATKAVRNSGLIPCVLYGRDERNIHFTTSFNDIRDLIFSPEFKIVEVNVNGNVHKCILKEVQFHPVNDSVEHIDFLELIENRPIKVELPLNFRGNSPGVRAGGKLQQKLRTVKVKTTPENLVHEVVADISKLHLGHSLRVRDIILQKGIEILNPPAIPIATVSVPRGLKDGGAEAEETAEATTETAEGAE